MQDAGRATDYRLRIRNAKQLVTVCANGEKFKAGPDQDRINIISDGTIVVNNSGRIEAVGPAAELEERFKGATFATDIDATGKVVVPGLVDGHTHPIWSGDRVHEFAMKLAGASYMEVHAAGGGIGFTVGHTRKSSPEELMNLLLPRLNRMLHAGTTLVECKSGYGLDAPNEMKLLKVLHEAQSKVPIEIVSTFLGAHSVPKGVNAEDATENVVNVQIPVLKELKEKGEISPDFIDVFLEKGVFDGQQTKRILEAGKAAGLEINFHGDELNPMQSGELGGELGALSISHLEKVSEEGIKAMSIRPTFAVLLPTTAYILRLEAPPARKFIQANVPVALGSDFNPNAHCLSMPLVMHLACVNMRLTMNESLVAATINAAGSLNRSATHGSLEAGKVGDMLLVDAPKWEHLVYQLGDPPIEKVIKAGTIVVDKTASNQK